MRTLSVLLTLVAMAAVVMPAQAQTWVATGSYSIDDNSDGVSTDNTFRVGRAGGIGAATFIGGSHAVAASQGEIGTGTVSSVTMQIVRGWGSLIMLGGELDLSGTASPGHVYIGRENATAYITQTAGTLRMGTSTKETFIGAPRTSGGLVPQNNGQSEGYVELRGGLMNMRGYSRVGAYPSWKAPVTSGLPLQGTLTTGPDGTNIGRFVQKGGTMDASLASGGLNYLIGWQGGDGRYEVLNNSVAMFPELQVGTGSAVITQILTAQGNTATYTFDRASTAVLKIGKDATVTASYFMMGESTKNVELQIEIASLTDFSQINCTGGIAIGVASAGYVGIDPKLTVSFAGHTPTLGDKWAFATGTSVDLSSGGFSAINAPALSDPNWSYEVRVENGTDLVLAVVPEPATLALLSLGGLALIRRRR